MSNASSIIDELISKGLSKWKMAKEIGISWRSLHNWHKGFATPNEKNFKKLIELNQRS